MPTSTKRTLSDSSIMSDGLNAIHYKRTASSINPSQPKKKRVRQRSNNSNVTTNSPTSDNNVSENSIGIKGKILLQSPVNDWVEVEDSRLREGVLKNGEHWETVSQHLALNSPHSHHRTPEDCQKRWNEVVCKMHKKVKNNLSICLYT